MTFVDNLELVGDLVSLEPLAPSHAPDLRSAVADGDLWRTWFTPIPRPEAVEADIDRRLALQRQGEMAPWAIRDLSSHTVVGVTSFVSPDEQNRRLEIGSTWLGRSAQGTGINTEAKLLLLTRAFDDLSSIAVEFRTHWHNRQSRAAILALGAKQDGVLRNHRLGADGVLRDTVVFSIIATEWPTVRFALVNKLSARAGR